MWSRWTGLALVLRTAAAEAFVASPAPECAWCEAGNDACNHSYAAYELDLVETSISGAVGGRRFPLWRPAYQPPFGAPSPATLAVVVHHGALRNGDAYCAHIYEAGDAGLDEATMLWWGASADDGVEPDRGERDWHWGGNSTAELGASLSSFSVLDEIIEALEAAHPALERVVVAGHSAGGQIAMRYALFSRLETRLAVEYFVANPSSVTYLNASRPALPPQRCCDNATIASTSYAFAAPGGRCADYDAYGYGLAGPLPDYAAATTAARAIDAYGRRTVVYVSGAADVCDARYAARGAPPASSTTAGSAVLRRAQGWCRMERLHAFAQFVTAFYGGDVHALVSVPDVGHSGCGIFQSREFARRGLG
ncbi:hypothetical protein JL720_10379 [Aureococcus anophagefferens]|nr:hypothetical protein JL720_10379 [Aureococcus anophagefferens]